MAWRSGSSFSFCARVKGSSRRSLWLVPKIVGLVFAPRLGVAFPRRVFGAAGFVCVFFPTGLAFFADLEDFGAVSFFAALRGATFLLDLGIKAISRQRVRRERSA